MIGDAESEHRSSKQDLHVVFEVDPSPESECPLGGFDGEIEDIRQQFAGGDCHTDTTVRTSDCGCQSKSGCTEVIHTTSPAPVLFLGSSAASQN